VEGSSSPGEQDVASRGREVEERVEGGKEEGIGGEKGGGKTEDAV
jgi:hypothetical protein